MNSQLLANAIRMLSVDAIQKANSGHPGAPMGMADIAEVVWRRHLRHNPKNPQWFNRDRYVQSNGHGSMLIYALLHLTGYDLSMDDIRDFRQLHSRTPGHPEYGYTPGVETTTGPLGQGVANAVGMAIAEKALAAEFNKPGFNIVDHHTWLFLGDGCLMEGISHEACGLAGTLKLGNLIAIWDDNGISIDGHVEGWFAEDTAVRFRAYGWHVIEGVDGHDPEAVDAALHGGFIPYGGTFLMFMEYARNALRMAALMKIRSVFVYTHDTIGLGEDGPTHQPVEQLASLRLTPNMETWRGCDQVEVAVAWQQAIERKDGPTSLVLTRQPLAQQPRTAAQLAEIARGGYVLSDCDGQPEMILISAGSEIELVVSAAKALTEEGRKVRVVSLPCTERFDNQDAAYKESVLPKAVRKRLAVEASIAGFWERYVGLDGKVIGMTSFGESAPANVLFKHFGFTPENVLAQARELLNS